MGLPSRSAMTASSFPACASTKVSSLKSEAWSSWQKMRIATYRTARLSWLNRLCTYVGETKGLNVRGSKLKSLHAVTRLSSKLSVLRLDDAVSSNLGSRSRSAGGWFTVGASPAEDVRKFERYGANGNIRAKADEIRI